MFGKKKDPQQEKPSREENKETDQSRQPLLPEEKIEVHAMPQKFLSEQAPKPKKPKPKLLIVLVVVVLVLLLSVAAALLFRKIIGPAMVNQPTNLAENNNLNEAENANLVLNLNRQNDNNNANSNVNQNGNGNWNVNLNTNQIVNGNQNSNANINTNLNANYNINTNAKIPSTLDADNDELTDIEEELYATEIKMPDTDSDGYIDGKEIKQGYSPIGPGLLNKTDIVKTYVNNSFNYSIIYPARWLARSATSDNSEILFTSDDVEFVQVTAVENISLLTIKEWYLAQFPESTEKDLIYVPLGSLLGIINPDGQTIYIAEGKYIYSINYNTGLAKEANFFATFEMMYRSFTVTSDKQTNSNANVNSNSNINSDLNSNTNQNTNQNSNQNANLNSNTNQNTNNSNQNNNSNTNKNSNGNVND